MDSVQGNEDKLLMMVLLLLLLLPLLLLLLSLCAASKKGVGGAKIVSTKQGAGHLVLTSSPRHWGHKTPAKPEDSSRSWMGNRE